MCKVHKNPTSATMSGKIKTKMEAVHDSCTASILVWVTCLAFFVLLFLTCFGDMQIFSVLVFVLRD